MITWPLMRLNRSISTINAIVVDKKLVKPITICHNNYLQVTNHSRTFCWLLFLSKFFKK